MHCRNLKEFKGGLSQPRAEKAMQFDVSQFQVLIHDEIDDVLAEAWNPLVVNKSVFLLTHYFDALRILDENLSYRFACFLKDSKLVGVAAFQITMAESDNLNANFDKSGKWVKSVSKKLLGNRKMRFRVLVLGNSFATGEHGFVFNDHIEPSTQGALLLKAIDEIEADCKEKGNRIAATVVKDFYPKSFGISEHFSEEGYAEFFVDPNMVMSLKPEWKTFDDYLASLTTKYRTKAKAAFKKSANIVLKDFDKEDLIAHREELFSLYEKVYDRADFRLGKLNGEVFSRMKENLGEAFTLKGYFLDDKLVGFQSAFKYENWIDTHFVGIDYNLNHQYSLYSRMLYEYIMMGIESGVKQISFGRTASEIKSTVGAYPIDVKCYIRHRTKTSNALLKLLFSYIRPSQFSQRMPFKQDVLKSIDDYQMH
ncbi:MAG: hypothetical protein ACI80P_000532 [Flavobacteriales bacterium]|jgi:hypothetical protein